MLIPTLRQLQFLVALGEAGSFSRAAEACHVTQPTLSAGIRELEDLLGVKLAERDQELQLAECWNNHRFDLWPNGNPSKFLFVAGENFQRTKNSKNHIKTKI